MYLITSRLCFASNNQSTVSEERSIKDGFWTKTAGLFPLRSLLAALHFHPCFLTHVSTRSFVGLFRLNWSVKISNKSVVSYEHNNLKSHFMQSVFCQLHNRVQSACGLHHNYSENTELHRVSQINTSRGEGSTESVSSIWSGLYLAVSALLARNDFLVSCKECRSPLRFFLRFCLVLFSAMHW